MRCNRHGRPSHGFTLIEVVVSLTLMTIIGVLVLSALRTGMAATEKGQLELASLRSRLSTVRILQNQLRGAVPLLYWTVDGVLRKTHVAFDGDRSSLRFVSRDSLFDGPDGVPRWVELSWKDSQSDGMAINVKEFRIIPPNNAADSQVIGEVNLLPGSECQFEYLRRARGTAPSRWLEAWNMDEERELPAAVRLTVRSKKQSSKLLIPLEIAPTDWHGLWFQ